MGKPKRCGAMWSDESIVAMLLGPMNSGNRVEGKNPISKGTLAC